jgi:hypothetical protein
MAMRKQIVVTLTIACCAATANAAGKFTGELELDPPGCEKQLECTVKTEFGYVDSSGVGWQAKAGLKTDGASIPSWAQPFVGGPFTKEFIRAAVIHDHYCRRHVRPWRTTHWVFYDALRASGVSEDKASLMYYAVYLGGPKWLELIKGESCPTGANCLQRIPDRSWPTNTSRVRSQESGATYMVRSHQYDAPGFANELKEVEKLIAEKRGSITREELEKRAQALRPGDFFYANPDTVVVPEIPGGDR